MITHERICVHKTFHIFSTPSTLKCFILLALNPNESLKTIIGAPNEGLPKPLGDERVDNTFRKLKCSSTNLSTLPWYTWKHALNTSTIYPIRFAQSSNVTSYKHVKCGILHYYILGMFNVQTIILWWDLKQNHFGCPPLPIKLMLYCYILGGNVTPLWTKKNPCEVYKRFLWKKCTKVAVFQEKKFRSRHL